MRISQPFPCRSIARNAILAILAGISLLNAGCGLKAPLYLPDEKEEQVEPSDTSKRRVTPRPAPQGPKQDRIDEGKSPGAPTPTSPVDPDRPATPPPGT